MVTGPARQPFRNLIFAETVARERVGFVLYTETEREPSKNMKNTLAIISCVIEHEIK
jgi:hypothetical protein